jgi:hypothetical protein
MSLPAGYHLTTNSQPLLMASLATTDCSPDITCYHSLSVVTATLSHESLFLFSELVYDWPFTANQFILASVLLRITTRVIFILQLNSCGHSPCVTSSLTRICLAFVKCKYRTCSMLLKVTEHSPLYNIQVLCHFRLCKADHAYLIYLLLRRQLGLLNGCKFDRRQV